MIQYLFLIGIVLTGQTAWAGSKASDVKQGNVLYRQGQYAEALAKYESALNKDEDSPLINFNVGAALYKNEEYGVAIPHFQKSLLSEDPRLQQKAHYNLGNALYQSGIVKENSDLTAAIQSLGESLSHYERSLSLNPEDQDAQFNYQLVKEELERLRAKKEKQQQDVSENRSRSQSENQSGNQGGNLSGNQSENQPENQPEEGLQNQPNSTETTHEPVPSGRDDSGLSPSSALSRHVAGERPTHPQELSQNEAQMLLEDYHQKEEPRGLLNMRLKGQKAHPVLKDW